MSARKRDYKTGGLRERSPNSWELKVRTRPANTLSSASHNPQLLKARPRTFASTRSLPGP
jgi:hypothetical protein